MEEGLKKLVGATLAVVLASALAIYVLGPSVGPSTSNLGPAPGTDEKSCGQRHAHGHDKASESAEAKAGRGKGHETGPDSERSPGEDQAKGPCPEPKAEKADKDLRGDAAGRGDKA